MEITIQEKLAILSQRLCVFAGRLRSTGFCPEDHGPLHESFERISEDFETLYRECLQIKRDKTILKSLKEKYPDEN